MRKVRGALSRSFLVPFVLCLAVMTESSSASGTPAGEVVGWGRNGEGQTNIPNGLSNVVAIAAGGAHSLALTAEGRVVGWGNNNYGRTNIPSGLSNVWPSRRRPTTVWR